MVINQRFKQYMDSLKRISELKSNPLLMSGIEDIMLIILSKLTKNISVFR